MREGIEAHRAKIADLAAALGQRYSVKLSLPTAESQHLAWFDAGTRQSGGHQPARPVFSVPPDVRAAAASAITTRFQTDLAQGRTPNTLPALQAGAQAIREAWVRRLSLSGDDVRWAPLAPAYARWKHRRGLDPRIGVATGRMLAAVRAGLIVIQRTR